MKPTLAPEQRDKLRSYIRARRAQAAAQRAAESMKDEVLAIVRLAGGRYTWLEAELYQGQSVTYTYPAPIKRAEELLKNKKKVAQLNGKAQKVETPCLQFTDHRAKAQKQAAQSLSNS